MKRLIAPSVLGLEHANMRGPLTEIVSGGAEMIHFDVMDGQFVPPITFGAQLIKGLRDIGDLLFEAHLMTLNPERHFEAFAEAGCNRIIYHAEATNHSHRLGQTLRSLGVQPAIAINPGTPAEHVKSVLDIVDLVLVMTVNPGWGAQQFIASALEKVRQIREWRPDVHIEVDGGIDATTLPIAAAAGANVFVVGNYLVQQPNLREAMQELNRLCA